MITKEDQLMCKALAGTGCMTITCPVYYIKRKGHLLLALPKDSKMARDALELYQPQSILAKIFIASIRSLVKLKMHWVLPKLKIEIRDNSPLANLVSNTKSMGFLLGNPAAEARCVVILHKTELGNVVDKVGLTKKSRESVMAELDVFKSLPELTVNVPTLIGQNVRGEWASYSTRFVEGRSPKENDDTKVVRLLAKWMEFGERVPLGIMKQWIKVERYASYEKADAIWEVLSEASELDVKGCVYHGDFAPWNIKISPDGDIVVLDWEHGSNEGPAGWDWAHYLIQRASLVEGLSAHETLAICRTWAKSEVGRTFLEDAGWGRYVELWIGTYLAYSGWIAGFDRDELILAWYE